MPARFVLKAAVAATLAAFGISMNAYSQNTPTASPNQSANTSNTAATNMAGSNDSARTVAGTKGSKASANGSPLDKGSVKFLHEAAAGSLAEVELGKLAQERAANAHVKEFGARMAKDHAKANDELKPIADAKNVALPSAPDKKTQREYDKLAKKSGADFDKAYMKHMLDDHKKDVKEFQKEAQKGKDADLKNFASSTLPTLEEHLRLAQTTYDEVRGKK
jgi:putative membrane protein